MCTPFIRNAFVLLVVAGVLSAAALAGDRCKGDPDVDIESLRGELWPGAGEWLLEIRYDVEVEDRLPPLGELELVCHVTEHGRTLVYPDGTPIEFVVALIRPSEVDDDEQEFEDRITVALPEGAFRDPDELRLWGAVYWVGDDRPLDRKDKSIKSDCPKPSRHACVRVGVGVGVRVERVRVDAVRVAPVPPPVVHRRVVVTRYGAPPPAVWVAPRPVRPVLAPDIVPVPARPALRAPQWDHSVALVPPRAPGSVLAERRMHGGATRGVRVAGSNHLTYGARETNGVSYRRVVSGAR